MNPAQQRQAVRLDSGRSYERQQVGTRFFGQVAGVLHSKPVEHFALGIVTEALPGDTLEYVLQRDEIQATVHKVSSWAEVSFHFRSYVGHGRVGTGLAVAFGDGIHVQVRGKSGTVGKEVADRDIDLLPRICIRPGCEFRNVALHLVAKAYAAAFDELHYGYGGADAFGDGCQVEDRFGGHPEGVGHDLPVAVSLQVGYLVAAHNGDHGAGSHSVADILQYHGIDLAEYLRIHSGFFGADSGKPAGSPGRAGAYGQREEEYSKSH